MNGNSEFRMDMFGSMILGSSVKSHSKSMKEWIEPKSKKQ